MCTVTFSLLDGISPPKKIAKRCAELGYGAVAMSDHGNIGAAVEFSQAVRKEGLKPILGCELYLCDGDPVAVPKVGRPYSHLVTLAKNAEGWKQIIRAVSRSAQSDHFYYNPRLCLDELRDFTEGGNLVAFSGHPGSDLGNVIFKSPKHAYNCGSYDEIKSDHIKPDAQKELIDRIEQYVSVFGKDNFFLEVQVLDPDRMPASIAIAKALRWASKRTGIPCVATADSHYVLKKDAADQRVLLASKLRTTMPQIERRIAEEEEVELGGFFKGACFHILSEDEMSEHHLPCEIEQSVRIADMCEDYEITGQPRLPAFDCPDGHDEASYLRSLCESGFSHLIESREDQLDRPISEYRDRLSMELDVIEGAGLPAYFLIVQDIMAYGHSRGWLLGPGRGSSAGSLVAYITGITQIDPLPYDLLFERFYNAGRNSPGRVSLPDIDLDFPIIKRDEVFKYLQGRYGPDKVAKIATFATLQGRSAIDAVLSVNEIPFDLRKQITSIIPDKARITEELQEMKDRGEEPSILRYALEVYADELAEWATLGDDGEIHGEFAGYFAQAMRLEGTKKHMGTHAAGVVISSTPLADLCPLIYDADSDSYTAAMEYPALEAMGLVKLDLLGIAMLNKGEGVRDLALSGRIT